jgi:RNA polymerase sigma-70 factor (ECF subfamily)
MVLLLKPFYLQKPATQEEFVKLVQEHRGMLHKVCRLYCFSEHDRQDLFQEIIIQLWKSYPKFRGESKFSTWLYRIALNTAISDLRKQRRRISPIDPDHLPTQLQDMQYSKDQEEQLQQLYAAIDQLTEVEKALVMLFLEDKSYEEMEEILGINQNNLRVKMNRIKEKLRKITKETAYGIGES